MSFLWKELNTAVDDSHISVLRRRCRESTRVEKESALGDNPQDWSEAEISTGLPTGTENLISMPPAGMAGQL